MTQHPIHVPTTYLNFAGGRRTVRETRNSIEDGNLTSLNTHSREKLVEEFSRATNEYLPKRIFRSTRRFPDDGDGWLTGPPERYRLSSYLVQIAGFAR